MSNKKILVVDDDAGIRESLKDLLSLDDYDCAVAASAEEGLAMMASEKPQLVVTDVQLPDMSGYQLCQTLKRNPDSQDVPVIMISGCFTEPEDRIQGFQLGADEFFPKPFDPAYFAARVRSILRI
jgi:DNA-binding response OmpR family regulator